MHSDPQPALGSGRPADAGQLVADLAAIGHKDREAFRRLYDRTSDAVWVVARDILRDANAAEDCVVDVYVQIWERGVDYDPNRGQPMSWMMTITRSRALDRLRRSRRRAERHDERDFPVLEGSEPNPLDVGEESERARILRGAVAHLPEDQRRAVELAFLEGWPHTRIAAQLDLPLGTIKARIRRGLIRLRQALESREVDL